MNVSFYFSLDSHRLLHRLPHHSNWQVWSDYTIQNDRITEIYYTTRMAFQIDAGQEALSANQIATFRHSANQSLSPKHQFENFLR